MKRYHYESNGQLVPASYRRASSPPTILPEGSKTLNGLTPYEFICKQMGNQA